MAQEKKDFTIPSPDVSATTGVAAPPTAGPEGVGPKGLAIGLGVLLALMVVFLVLRGMYANYLVAKKVAPPSANQAGWWLFILLASLGAAATFSIVDQARFLSFLYLVPLGIVAVVALSLMVLSSRR